MIVRCRHSYLNKGERVIMSKWTGLPSQHVRYGCQGWVLVIPTGAAYLCEMWPLVLLCGEHGWSVFDRSLLKLHRTVRLEQDVIRWTSTKIRAEIGQVHCEEVFRWPTFTPHLWPWALASDWKNKTDEMGSGTWTSWVGKRNHQKKFRPRSGNQVINCSTLVVEVTSWEQPWSD